MRKIAAAVLVVVLSVWALLWLGAWAMRGTFTASSGRSWPLGLGTLREAPSRYPITEMSGGAAKLIALATPLGIDLAPRAPEGEPPQPRPLQFVREQVSAWVSEQLTTPVPDIEPLPAESGEYLAGRAADITAIRTLLLSNEPIVWPEDVRDPAAPMPNLFGYLQLNRVLVARALDRGRVDDRGGWEDLRAAWHLMKTLAGRHEVIVVQVALAGTRQIDAAARKMPLPPPAWLQEVHAFDFRRALIGAFQADAWRVADRVRAETTIDEPRGNLGRFARRGVDAVMAPYARMAAVDLAEAWRRSALDIAETRSCELDEQEFARRHPPSAWNIVARQITTANLTGMWQRLLRWGAQREATVRALRLRAGESPLPQSSCVGAAWVYAEDGRSFRFSRPLGERSPAPIPLEFQLGRAPGEELPSRPP